MIKYKVFYYDLQENEEYGYVVNDIIPSGVIIFTDTSKSSIGKKLGLDPYKMDVLFDEDVIYIDYDGKPYCELWKID